MDEIALDAIKKLVVGTDVQYITSRPHSETEMALLIKKEITGFVLCTETSRKMDNDRNQLEFLINGRDCEYIPRDENLSERNFSFNKL